MTVQAAKWPATASRLAAIRPTGQRLPDAIRQMSVGKRTADILFEDLPGLTKKVTASLVVRPGGGFKPIQLTPDGATSARQVVLEILKRTPAPTVRSTPGPPLIAHARQHRGF